MTHTTLAVCLTLLSTAGDDGISDAKSLVAAMESLHQRVEDFRCEFEGISRYLGKAAEDPSTKIRIDRDGIHESFSGVFVWKKNGDTYNDCLARRAVGGKVERRTLAVRAARNEAERYQRYTDASLGFSEIDKLRADTTRFFDCVAWIFPIDRIKREIMDESLETTVSDDQVDGLPLKTLRVAMKIRNAPSLLMEQYWVDLRRGGHVVRHETYSRPDRNSKEVVVASRLDIELAPFRLDGSQVWMPVSGETVGYGATEDHKPVFGTEPTVLDSIKVVGGTMEFNKHPGPDVFTIKYKPGTPISDNLRKLTYEFGQQKMAPKPSKAELEKSLKQQVAQAEEQKSELVAATPSEGFDWSSLAVWGTGAAVLLTTAAFWLQRRR